MCYILLRPLRIVGRLVIVLCIETKKREIKPKFLFGNGLIVLFVLSQ